MKIKLIVLLLFVTGFSFAQNGSKSVDGALAVLKEKLDVTFFEVSEEMFQMLSEADNTPPQLKEYYRKLTKIVMIEENGRGPNHESPNNLYDQFLEQANLKNFTRLMVSESSSEKLAFYKYKASGAENQFLLVGDGTIIYVVGTIDLKSIHEFQLIMNIAGSAIGK